MLILLAIFSITSINANNTVEECVYCDSGDAPESYGPGGIKSNQSYSPNNMRDDTNSVSVDPENISYTYNNGVLDIHVNDTYPGLMTWLIIIINLNLRLVDLC